jgi:hypothetical protein
LKENRLILREEDRIENNKHTWLSGIWGLSIRRRGTIRAVYWWSAICWRLRAIRTICIWGLNRWVTLRWVATRR